MEEQSVSKLRVLVACEYSATVRDAFRARGFDAWSCDLLQTEGDARWHYVGNVLDMIGDGWDLLIAHPPCTDLAVSGARHFAAKIADGRQDRALEFVRRLLDAPIRHIALENPVSVISSKIRKPDQTIQPWQFGHGETKATCLWLKNLPPLVPTNIVSGREPRIHRMPPGPDRWKERSRMFPGIAAAMADQWGDYIRNPPVDLFGEAA
jgi:site-specific DNA-cytosine methylase